MDKQYIFSIIEKFNSTDITELVLDDGTTRLELRKEQIGKSKRKEVLSVAEKPSEKSVHLGISAKTETISDGEKITSPIVGTFYSSPSPDAPSFVKLGSRVKAGETFCILEAMKMMNHLEAEFDCEIMEILVSSGELVEYGQSLFIVKRL